MLRSLLPQNVCGVLKYDQEICSCRRVECSVQLLLHTQSVMKLKGLIVITSLFLGMFSSSTPRDG